MTKGLSMSQHNTTYDILVNDEVVDNKSKKSAATELAEAKHAEDTTQKVEVKTSNGTSVLVLEPKTKGARPWTRTETHDSIEVEVPEGYTVAYTRARVGAVVARADDKSGWLVITTDGNQTPAENTKVAREITNQLAADHKVEQEKARQAELIAKAEAKAKRDADRAEAKAAKEAEKAEKARLKAEAKAAKEAEAAATAEVADEDEVLADA
jgi:hypothetical protein